jgi:hypothetical protein
MAPGWLAIGVAGDDADGICGKAMATPESTNVMSAAFILYNVNLNLKLKGE